MEYNDDKICYNSCPEFTVEYKGKCYDTCPEDSLYISTTKCDDKCPSDKW